ncbi:hypothetical protein AVEN_217889-1 [Araneus ventricosus]|uniref:Uncharacterized protein n=1 Tax=Araneus ventricosus TaxID=182803 RepID=A0A4Y2EGQ3_ARAVE|nr:hypothetical protein AVEN_217889-1 [Araneus ventricosus]
MSFFSKPNNSPPNPKSEGITSTCTSETNFFNERELLLLPSSSTSEVEMETDLPSQSDDESEIQSQSNLHVKLMKETIQNQNGPVSGLEKCGIARKIHFLG